MKDKLEQTHKKLIEHKEAIFFMFIIGVAFYIKCREDLIRSSLNLDEILTWKITQTPFTTILDNISHDVHMPLYFIIMSTLSKITELIKHDIGPTII